MNCKVFLILTHILSVLSLAPLKKANTINALVLPCSYPTDGYQVWNSINQNEQTHLYGPYDVFVNTSVAINRSFSYNDLTTADVLILSDNVGIGCYLTTQEILALSDYLSEGHNIIGTYVIFQDGVGTVENLFGFGALGSYTTPPGSQVWYAVNPSTLDNNLGSPWTASSYAGNVYPSGSGGWSSVAQSTNIIFQNADKTGVVTTYSPGTYNAIYISYMPEYSGGQQDTQLLYNAITYGYSDTCSSYTTCPTCAGSDNSQCAWCLESQTCLSDSTQCRSFIHNPQYCPKTDCSGISSCESCLDDGNNQYCDWCLDTSSCIDLADRASCDDAINDGQYCGLR